MQSDALRASSWALVVSGLAGCVPSEGADNPSRSADADERQVKIAEDQEALERRRLALENQVLGELRKLREARQASAGNALAASEGESDGTAGDDLLIFGGSSREVFLGCLCEEHRPDSVFLLTGEHGSDLSPVSLRNKFSPYGSNYHDTSACNPSATHPPSVLSSDGKSLGLLTLNGSLKRKIDSPSVVDWLKRMCSQ
jgi:hypothetical protein